ncbi:MAG: hypothetical protein K9L59_10085 [Desulfobacterales bacterium]|nr:hypothetical protein [Desulfobacterales bacterium]
MEHFARRNDFEGLERDMIGELGLAGMEDRLSKREFQSLLDKKVRIEGGSIVMTVRPRYEIDLSRCNTKEKILEWVAHLSRKTWVDRAVTSRFIELACGYHGLKY